GGAVLGAAGSWVARPPAGRPGGARGGRGACRGRRGGARPAPRGRAHAPAAADLLRRQGLLRTGVLAAMGVTGGPPPVAGEWLADPVRWADLRRKLAEVVAAHARHDPLAVGMPPEAARAALGLPDRALVEALVRGPGPLLTAGPPAPPGPQLA